jgi:ABC-2 type transport system permease protein
MGGEHDGGWSRRYPETERVPWRRQVRAFAVRATQRIRRDRAAFFWAFAWPVFWYVLTSVLFLSEPVAPDVTGASPEHVLGLTKAITAISYGFFGATSVSLVVIGTNLSSDRTARRYRMLGTLPVAPSADVAGRFLAVFAFAVLSFLAVLVVGALDGALFAVRSAASVPIVAVALFAVCLAASGVGVVLSEVLGRREYVAAVGTVLLIVSYFFSAFYGADVASVPTEDGLVVNTLPMAVGTRLGMSHLVDLGDAYLAPPLPPLWLALATLLGGGALCFAAGVAVARTRVYAHRGEA